jgi:hypothetical protein
LPPPADEGAATVPRYVILEHDHPHLHWDLMLEAGDVLRTWRLAAPPRAGGTIAAEDIFNHRKAYLDYEGPVSGGRGRVVRWDAGMYALDEEAGGRLVLRLDGGRLRGTAVLARAEGGAWSLTVTEEGG